MEGFLKSAHPYEEAYELAAHSISLLSSQLRDLRNYINFERANNKVFGPAIRQILIFAANEFEASCRGILRANSYKKKGDLNTTDYVKLNDPLKLESWELCLELAPNFDVLVPFRGWHNSRPTASLPWYDAYNACKHDAAQNRESATLRHAAEALAAVTVLLLGQFGPHAAQDLDAGPLGRLVLRSQPKWTADELYVNPQDVKTWRPKTLFP